MHVGFRHMWQSIKQGGYEFVEPEPESGVGAPQLLSLLHIFLFYCFSVSKDLGKSSFQAFE